MRRSAARTRRIEVSALLVAALALAANAQEPCQLEPPIEPPVGFEDVQPIPVLGQGSYLGAMGGLYPGGQNEPPSFHRPVVRSFAQQIVPRAPDGSVCSQNPTCDHGLIGVVSIGFSNPTQEFGAFAHRQNAHPTRDPRIVLVSGSRARQDVKKITCSEDNNGNPVCELDADLSNAYWEGVAEKVERAGLTKAQVQAAWIKATMEDPIGSFEDATARLRNDLVTLVQLLKHHYPNVQIAYVSSRTYSGYSSISANPEPYAYEEGFAYKQLIEDQITGADPGLDYTDGTAPLVLWGPYLWANADLHPYDDLIWCPEDYEQNGLNPHQNEIGERKVSDRLAAFFATDPAAAPWWRAPAGAGTALVGLAPTDDTFVEEARGCAPDFGDHERLLVTVAEDNEKRAFLRFDLSPESRPVVRAFLGLRVDPAELMTPGAGRLGGPTDIEVIHEADDDWEENGISWCDQPSVAAPAAHVARTYSRGSYVLVDVTEAVASDTDGIVGFRLDTAVASGERGYMSKEADPAAQFTFPPQLVLLVEDP